MGWFDFLGRGNAPQAPAPAVNTTDSAAQTRVNALAGKPLRYLIGAADPGAGQDGRGD